MNANVQAVLILVWIVLAVCIVGLGGLWFWIRRDDREFRERMERIRADRG